MDMHLSAAWVWLGEDFHQYNQAVLFHKAVQIDGVPAEARLAFSADSEARIFVNGTWIADGPCRGWPHAYYYDVVELPGVLRAGENEILAVARYFGSGTFHQIPQQAGFLLQLDVKDSAGQWSTLAATDHTWRAAPFLAWRQTCPKMCVQMGPGEWIDARRGDACLPAIQQPIDQPVSLIAPVHAGPWGRLRPRDVALPGRYQVQVPAPSAARVVKAVPQLPWAVPVRRLCHPQVLSTNRHASRNLGLATVIHAERATRLPWPWSDWIAFVNGRRCDGMLELDSGANAMLCFVSALFDHRHEAVLDEPRGSGLRLQNPLDAGAESAWAIVVLPEFDWVEDDMCWSEPPRADRQAIRQQYHEFCNSAGSIASASVESLQAWLNQRGARPARREQIAWDDPHAAFVRRQPLRILPAVQGGPFPVTLAPEADGDIELHIDLGDQYCGYHQIDLEAADQGAALDVFLVENVAPDGRVQNTPGARNGFRYICRKGRQRYRSLLRRSGRHLFLTARGLGSPITIHGIHVTESRYPARLIGWFNCDDDRLNRLWNMARRTLELCMDDVYVDCPLYEQTLWIGDLQPEQLYGLWTFDARDISLRSLRLAAQSLARLPMIGAQVPSSWDMILPAWSFLWGIAVWDYYFYSGEKQSLAELWPAVRMNLLSAQTYLNERGLFDAPFWNLFDWTPLQQQHRVVLHNSMFMIGAIDAGIRCANVLGHIEDAKWLGTMRQRIVRGVESTFDPQRGGYPDAYDESGQPVGLSQHPQFLALLYDVAAAQRIHSLQQLVLSPPPHVTRCGSPFALHYFYGTLQKLGQGRMLIDAMLRDFKPMLDANATTLWEMFPESRYHEPGWPTRSHCHGWSASPLYYLPQVILGIRPTAAGGREFRIEPELCHLGWAEGAVATPHGPLYVRVERAGEKIQVHARPPSDAVRVITGS